jgi:glycosyltransferase involved in cell wall biosynthesis
MERSTTAEKASNSRVSVFVPCHNHERFIERCLRSIFKQEMPPSELLVIDDGSRDDSVKIADRTLKDCPFPSQLFARENHGLSKTLNEGFAKTSGDYFCYLGSDDLWLPAFLAARVDLLASKPDSPLAHGHVYVIDEDDRITDCTRDWGIWSGGWARERIWNGAGLFSPSVCFRRAALPESPWNEAARLEDYELYLRLSARLGERGEFAFDERPLSAWRRHGSNNSGDLTMMLDETLSAQQRVAAEIGISAAELERHQASVRWRTAEMLARAGDKGRAWSLARHNWVAAPSVRAAVRMLARLAVPGGVLAAQRRKREERSARRYGTLPNRLV